jgi:hypothetical protein
MYYLVTIGYESEQLDRNGDPRIQKVKYVVEAETVEETTIIVAKYREGDTRSSQTMAIAQLPIECVISPKTHSEYYKSKTKI